MNGTYSSPELIKKKKKSKSTQPKPIVISQPIPSQQVLPQMQPPIIIPLPPSDDDNCGSSCDNNCGGGCGGCGGSGGGCMPMCPPMPPPWMTPPGMFPPPFPLPPLPRPIHRRPRPRCPPGYRRINGRCRRSPILVPRPLPPPPPRPPPPPPPPCPIGTYRGPAGNCISSRHKCRGRHRCRHPTHRQRHSRGHHSRGGRGSRGGRSRGGRSGGRHRSDIIETFTPEYESTSQPEVFNYKFLTIIIVILVIALITWMARKQETY